MQTMYPGQPNSPQTELASAIDDEQTTIPLLDASVLPDPPNICTIGIGEDAETILYTGKSGNNLTGVTRGFQGAAKSWGAGVKVARLFTAYDYDALRENLEDHASATTGVHGATSAATPNTIVQRDSAGRIKAAAPAASDDVARKEEVDAHANRTDNPHAVTKAQIGLGNVQNYGIATQAQAESGSSNNVYMTPQRTKQYVDTRLRNSISFRINSGVLEYFNGTEWLPVGTDLSSMTPGYAQGRTSSTTESTILSISGSGILVSINQLLTGASASYSGNLKVVIDGKTLVSDSDAFARTSGGSAGNSATLEFFARFNTSLLVTHKLSGSGEVITKVAYLLD